MEIKNKNILIVDDEADIREIFSYEFKHMNAKIFEAENGKIAFKLFKENSIDLIISDIRMPGGSGIDLIKDVVRLNPEFKRIILLSGYADITSDEAVKLGAKALLQKPFDLDDILKLIESL